MDNSNETIRAQNISDTKKEELRKEIAEKYREVLKMRLIFRQLEELKPETWKELVESDSVKRALKIISIHEYLQGSENGQMEQWLLDLNDLKIDLSYTEQKAVRKHLWELAENKLKPILKIKQKIREELPEIFEKKNHDDGDDGGVGSLTGNCALILSMEKERRENLKKLSDIRIEKCKLLKEVAVLKYGQQLPKELEAIFAETQLNLAKLDLLQAYFTNEFITSTEHSKVAIQEVKGYIDDILENADINK